MKWPLGYNALGVAEVIAQQLIYLLSGVGALILVCRRRVEPIARRIGLLTIATLVFLVAIRLSGTLATFYNAERALLQAMVILDIPLFWCLQALAGQRRLRQACAATAGAVLIGVIFVASNGLAGAVLGGGTATNLANSGTDYRAVLRDGSRAGLRGLAGPAGADRGSWYTRTSTASFPWCR